MGYPKVMDDIINGRFAHIYLFHGEEEYIKREALSMLSNALVTPELREFNRHIIDGSDVEIDAVINACETLPFMADKRLVIVKDFFLLSGKKGTEEQEGQMINYLYQMSESTCLVFYNHGNADKTRKLFKALRTVGTVASFDYLKKPYLQKWLLAKLRRHKKSMHPRDIQYFLSLCGNELDHINNEIDKLISYTGDGEAIGRSDIDKMLSPNLEYNIFKLIDRIGNRKGEDALIVFNELISQGQPILLILSMISWQLRNILECTGYIKRGYSKEEIMEKLKLKSYTFDKSLQQGKFFTAQQLEKGLEECLKVDYGIKKGLKKDRFAMEVLIIKLCTA